MPRGFESGRAGEPGLGVLLQQELSAYQRAVALQLGVLARPPINLVVEHVRHLCDTNGTLPSRHVGDGGESCLEGTGGAEEGGDFKAYLRMDVMKRVYQYLQVVQIFNYRFSNYTKNNNYFSDFKELVDLICFKARNVLSYEVF